MPRKWSGKRGSNPRPSAWKADALPTELLPPLHKTDNEFLNLFFPLDKSRSLPSWVNRLTSVPDTVKQLIPLILLKSTLRLSSQKAEACSGLTLSAPEAQSNGSKKAEKVKDEWFSRWAADYLVERGGFEPPKASPTDLQSVPFGRSGTSPTQNPLFFDRASSS